MKKFLLLFLSFTSFTAVMAQNYWSAHTGTDRIVTNKSIARKSFPANFKLFDLDINPLRKDLFSVVGNTSKQAIVISIPNAKGEIEKFELTEASNFDKQLQTRFPEIRAFSGKGITDKAATLKLSISPQGIQTMVFRTENENEFIEAYSGDHKVYAVFKSERTPGKLPWSCTTEDQKLAVDINTQANNNGITARSGGNLKTMRLAQSVTAEYSNYFGATSASQVGLVLAGINATLARCNGVYEKDLALHLNLVAASTNVIYYNAATDPYSNAASGAGGAWNSELQSTLTSVIGEANYDIGHLFGASGGGGNAGCIGCICTNGSKGSGFTSPADGIPEGDNFDIDYVVHEVGHQLGANHTFSYGNEGTGVNKEVASGITIMGYAGITSWDVAAHSIDIYHEASIAQIQSNLGTKTCPVTNTITNATPVVASVANYTIPISTPFALTGSATDANGGDVLTYCWEQNDNASAAQTGNSSRASATKATGPNWISFPPTTSPTRYFPKLSTILAGGTTSGPLTGGDAGVLTEALSSVSRTLNFRLTVRDNAPYHSTAPISVGQTQFTDMAVTVTNTSGPFSVTAPNTAVSWAGGSTQTITWNVASTTVAPVSCANVKISLSTDGGQTFPTVLIASTPNDGSQSVTIPSTATTTARVKVEAVGNIFFDISNTNFTITSGPSCATAFEPNETRAAAAAITSGVANSAAISTSTDVDYYKITTTATGNIVYTLAGPSGVDYDLYVYNSSGTQIGASEGPTATESVSLTSQAAGTYYVQVIGYDGANSATCYTITATATATGCQSSYDISANGTRSGAAVIPFNTNIKGLISPSADVDYYKFTITTGGTITLTLTTLPKDYDLVLQNSAGTQVAISENSGTTGETINYTATAGVYYAQVYGWDGANSATSCYTLKVALGTATKSQLIARSTGDKKLLSVYPNPAQTKININLTGYKGVSEIRLYDINGNQAAVYRAPQVNSTIDISKLPGGVYMLKIITSTGEVLSTKVIKQ